MARRECVAYWTVLVALFVTLTGTSDAVADITYVYDELSSTGSFA